MYFSEVSIKKGLPWLFFLFTFQVFGVPTETLWIDCSIRVRHEDSRKWLEDVPVELFCEGKRLKVLMSARDGKVWMNLETGKQYEIQVNSGPMRKPLISKIIRFDLRNIDLNAWRYRKSTIMKYQYEIEILLFEPEPCERFDFLKEDAVIHYVYSEGKKDLDDIADAGITRKIRKIRRKSCKSERAIF